MSDVTTGTAFNPQFFMNPPWWLGRVEDKETWKDNIKEETFTNIAGIEGWGHRYKVRIFNWHTGDLSKLPPEQMAFCQVIMPVTAGSGHGGASVTPSIESGSVVFGFFMDGMAGQEGYIMGVLGNSNNNVPKERGQSVPVPPPLPNGPGSLSDSLQNIPDETISKLTTDQLNKLLNPAETPSSQIFKASTKAKQEAKIKGLPESEITRLGQVASVLEKKKSGTASSAGSSGNCNIGYQQFNNTFSDSNKSPAYVPDNLNVYNAPLQITEGLHLTTLAWDTQDQDKKIKRPLSNACKKDDSDLKGIARVIKNLIAEADKIKRAAGEVSLAASSIQSQLNNIIQAASSFISSYMTNLLGRILETLEIEITKLLQKEVIPFLFPSERPTYNNVVSEALEIISCIFKKIISSLVPTIAKLLVDLIERLVSGPICVVQQLISDFLNPIIGEITSALSGVLGVIGNITSLVSSAFDFLSGILDFFKCNEDQACPEYDEIDLEGPAKPGIQIGDFSSEILKTLAPPGTTPSRSVNCNAGPILCGPPTVNFFGGGGSGAIANPIVSSTSSIIGFDIINAGSYTSTPTITLEDPCGKGSGGSFKPVMEPDKNNPGKLKIKSISVNSPGTGYLSIPNGSLGANGFTWKDYDEGYVIRSNETPVTAGGTSVIGGSYEIVKIGVPTILNEGDIYFAPYEPPREIKETESIILQITPGQNLPLSDSDIFASGGTPITAGGTPITAGGTGGTPVTAGGNGGTPITAGGTPITSGGTGGTPITAGGTSITVNGTPVTAGGTGGTPITAGGTGGTPVTVNGTPITSGGTGGTPVTVNGTPVTAGGTSTTAGGTSTTAGGTIVPSYRVLLTIEELEVVSGGYGYREGDEIIITPNNGLIAKPIINSQGQIIDVEVLQNGMGFNDIPEIKTNSSTGFNALINPRFTITRIVNEESLLNIPEGVEVMRVVDCVGRVN